MKNAAVIRAQREGFQFHGSTAHSYRPDELERLQQTLILVRKEVAPFGGQAKILQVIETSEKRDGSIDKYHYSALYVKYTPEYWADYYEKKAAKAWEDRKAALRKFVYELSQDEALYLKSFVNDNVK